MLCFAFKHEDIQGLWCKVKGIATYLKKQIAETPRHC